MCSCRQIPVFILLWIGSIARADGYVVGFGAEGDSADGRAISAFGDFGVGDDSWLSITAISARTDGIIKNNDTLYADVGIDHWFEPVGFRLGASYWGNPDILDSRDLRASIYLRGEPGSISLDYEKRNFEFDLQSDLLRGRTAEFSADGWGLSTRLALGERVSFLLGGITYDYSRNIRLQQDIDALTFLSSSRLSMVNSLIDYRFNVGCEFRFGLKSIDVTAGRWQTAIDGSTVDSYSLGYLSPVSDRIDVEIRLAFDDSETFGRSTALSFHLYYFGGV
jgi:hypothetical protein